MYRGYSDKQLVEALENAPNEVMTEIIRRYGRLCMYNISGILENIQDAEDALNEAYMIFWEQIPRDKPEYLKEYLCKVSKLHALQKYRNIKRKNKGAIVISVEYLGEADKLIEGNINNPEDLFIAKIGLEEIEVFLNKRTEKEKMAYKLRYFYGLSIKDTAREMGITSSNVSTLTSRVKRALIPYMKKRGYGV